MPLWVADARCAGQGRNTGSIAFFCRSWVVERAFSVCRVLSLVTASRRAYGNRIVDVRRSSSAIVWIAFDASESVRCAGSAWRRDEDSFPLCEALGRGRKISSLVFLLHEFEHSWRQDGRS